MDVTTLYSIGELSRRTGLSVRTIRFYSDSGVVAPTTRSPAGHRLYDLDALLRLELLRTLRELGMDLATIQRVLDRELSVAEVAAAHADAMDVQIRMLLLRRSVLRVVARRGSNAEETKLMHRLTQLSGKERQRLIDDFVDGTFGTVDADPAAVAMVRAATPDLPDDPSSEQVAAWVELAELVGDEDFRARMRRTAMFQAAGRTLDIESDAGEELMEFTRQKVAEAMESGIDLLSDRVAPVFPVKFSVLVSGAAEGCGTGREGPAGRSVCLPGARRGCADLPCVSGGRRPLPLSVPRVGGNGRHL
ncbi:MerR family transcriptional regulator [Streptomyces mirabilis]|uniref:helix-turn-helix domain-containing protein n=1 Tax=Streptomyces mirabilis TaxID=68239 RepID=UPI00332BE6B9